MRLSLLLALGLLTASPARAADDASPLLKRGIEEQMRGEFARARSSLNKAIDEDGKAARPHVVLAMTLLESGDGPGARMHLERAIKLGHPRNAAAPLLAHALLLDGQAREALELASDQRAAPKFRGYAARVRALALVRLERQDDAGAEFDRAAALDPGIRGLWSDIADFRHNAGDLAGAIEAALREVNNAPRSRRAMMQLGGFVRDRYGLVAALPWFRRAVLLDPGNIEALGELAATLGDAGHTVEMLAVTRRMIEIDPGHPRAWYLQAVLAARADKPELARALLFRTGGKMDEVPAVVLLNAVLEMKAGSPELAIARLQKLVDMQPDNLKARRLLGAALWRAGDASGTVDALRNVARRGDADSYTLSILGRAYEQQGARSEAAAYLDRAGLGDGSEAAPFDMSADLVRLARATSAPTDHADQAVPWIAKAVQDGRLNDAIAHARRLAEQNPGAPAAQMLEGDALAAAGRHGEAIAAYRRAADLRFNEPVMLRLVDSHIAAGNVPEALRVLDYFLSQNPRSVPGLLLAADHFMSTGQWAKAATILSGLQERLGGRDAAIASNLGWALFNKGDVKGAAQHAGQAHQLLPNNPGMASAYGWILFKSGLNKPRGLALMRKSVRIDKLHPELRFRLGQALAANGDKKGAREQLAVAAATPDYPMRNKAQAMLARL